MHDELGVRMKHYEKECDRRLSGIVMCRVDGRNFSKFTKQFRRPFDPEFAEWMNQLCEYLVRETNALAGYVQSDEITLTWEQPPFDGKQAKMNSLIAAMASVRFSQIAKATAHFDCRTWVVPSRTEGMNVFQWRWFDARRNSVQMAAHYHFSANKCFKKSTFQLIDMLEEIGVRWQDYPHRFKFGLFVLRRKSVRPYTFEEWQRLPEKHHARTDPNLRITRTDILRDECDFEILEDRVGYIYEES